MAGGGPRTPGGEGHHLRAPADQPYDESVGEECQLARWIKEVDPKLQVIRLQHARRETARRMDALTDIWVPTMFNFAEMGPSSLVKDAKKPHWCYFYSEGGADNSARPHATLPGEALVGLRAGNQRRLLMHSITATPGIAPTTDTYDTARYPTEAGPIPSRRWQAWRRGWQDARRWRRRGRPWRAGDQPALPPRTALADVAALPGNPQRAETARA